jgi:DNA-dependent RNA polymerase auxiliary subunit epsilon
MATSKSPEYAKQAQKVLKDVSSFDIKFIEQLVDAYLNDPYLTKS